MGTPGGGWSDEQRAREQVVLAELASARASNDTAGLLRARDELALMHSGFVRYLARKNFGTVDEDLTQAGMLGLLTAIDRFDPSYDNTLTTFAVHHILAAMREVRDSESWSVSVPRRLRQLNGRIRAVREQHTDQVLSVLRIADILDEDPEDVIAAMSIDDARHAASLSSAPTGEGSLADTVGADDDALARVEARETIRALLHCLDERERQVVVGLFLEERRQQEIAEALGISQSQVSRIRQSALERMRGQHQG